LPDTAPASDAPKSVDPAVLAQAIAALLDENKAEEILTIDLRGKTSIADTMIIASGRSNRQVSALASRVIDTLREDYGLRARAEGQSEGDWVLIDAQDIIVHLFRPEVRAFYALEKMWAVPGGPTPDKAPNTRDL
jgi:ribosome-associated protein